MSRWHDAYVMLGVQLEQLLYTTFAIQAARSPRLPGQPSRNSCRLGHSSPRAAMIYQHATRDRDETIASRLGQLLRNALTPKGDPE